MILPRFPKRLQSLFLLLSLYACGALLGGCKSNPPEPENGQPTLEEQMIADAQAAEEARIARLGSGDPGGTEEAAPADPVPGAAPAEEPAKVAQGKPAGSEEDGQAEFDKKKRELVVAQLERKIAENGASHAATKAAEDRFLAEKAVKLATAAQERYRIQEGPTLIAVHDLKVDRLVFSYEESDQNLKQMKAEYGRYETDDVAKRTGEIVIWRAEKRLSFAARSVTQARKARKLVTDTTIPMKLEELQAKILAAQSVLRRAEEKIGLLAFENMLKTTRAANKVLVLEEELAKLRNTQPQE